MTASSLPSLFVSHGAPTLIIETGAGAQFLRGLAALLPRPQAVLCITAHWESSQPLLGTTEKPGTIHDFYGFPRQLYELRYPAPGAPALAERAGQLLRQAGVAPEFDAERGLDHGSWVPMMLAWPEADIPVAQMTVSPDRGAAFHIALGEALAPLRKEGVLILGSGGAVHNLGLFHPGSTQVVPWAQEFEDWLTGVAERGDKPALANYRKWEVARLAHPRDEHLLPFMVALGAGGKGRALHRGFEHGSLSLAAFAFGEE